MFVLRERRVCGFAQSNAPWDEGWGQNPVAKGSGILLPPQPDWCVHWAPGTTMGFCLYSLFYCCRYLNFEKADSSWQAQRLYLFPRTSAHWGYFTLGFVDTTIFICDAIMSPVHAAAGKYFNISSWQTKPGMYTEDSSWVITDKTI